MEMTSLLGQKLVAMFINLPMHIKSSYTWKKLHVIFDCKVKSFPKNEHFEEMHVN
jgi:hypothetical protein